MTRVTSKRSIFLTLCILYCQRDVKGSFIVHHATSSGGSSCFQNCGNLGRIYIPREHRNVVGMEKSGWNTKLSRRIPTFSLRDRMEAKDSGPSSSSSSTRLAKYVSDFVDGFQHVSENYLDILLKYSIQMTMKLLLPFTLFLLISQYISPNFGSMLFRSLDQTLLLLCSISNVISRFLLLPIVVLEWFWNAAPTLIVPILDLMPRALVLHFVSFVLYIQQKINLLIRTPFLSALGIVFWWPTVSP